MLATALALLVPLSGGPMAEGLACIETPGARVAFLPNMAAGGFSPVVTAQWPGGAAVAMPPALFVGGGGGIAFQTPRNLVLHTSSRAASPTDPAPIPPVPLPASLWMMLSGLAALWWRARA